MRLLLDTHVWLWNLLEPERLSASATEVLADPENDLHLSPISIWETLVLARKGRLHLEPTADRWVGDALQRSAARMAPITHAVARKSEDLESFEKLDPADRFLVATALLQDLTLVTADRTMLRHPPLATIW